MLSRLFTKATLSGALLFLGLYSASFFLSLLPGAQKLELSVLDQKYRRYAPVFSAAESPIVIVDIDDASYAGLRAVWPWPRSYYARLIRNLRRAGARLIAIDVMFDKSRSDDPEGDALFSKVLLEKDDVVLAGKTAPHSLDLPDSLFLRADSSNCALVDVVNDLDGVVREYICALPAPDRSRIFPTLAVKAFGLWRGGDSLSAAAGKTFRIAFPGGAKTFRTVPFYEVLDDSAFETKYEEEWGEPINSLDTLFRAGVFRGKIVLVGASMMELHDVALTPFSADAAGLSAQGVPGVEIHAAALHTLLTGRHIADLPPLLVYAVIFLLCLIIFIVSTGIRSWVAILLAVLASLAWTATSFKLFSAFNVILPVVPALFAIGLTLAGEQGYLFYLEQHRRRQVTGMFGRYVPKEVVQELIKDPGKLKLGGERRELSVLFSDIADFTTLSENLAPEALIELLNEYLTAMTAIVHENGGIIDKYEGDAIMAEFGIPILVPDHAERACRTAFSMQKRLYELREKWGKQGRPQLKARVGICSGTMVFGNMGSEQAFDYTVIGDVVNLASRLEGANKEYGTQIMINERAFELARGSMLARELDVIRVKGKKKAVKCFHLMSSTDSSKADQIRKVIEIFEQGLVHYRKQGWKEAIDCFERVLNLWPDDGPAKLYLERCHHLKSRDPKETWDGIFTMKGK